MLVSLSSFTSASLRSVNDCMSNSSLIHLGGAAGSANLAIAKPKCDMNTEWVLAPTVARESHVEQAFMLKPFAAVVVDHTGSRQQQSLLVFGARAARHLANSDTTWSLSAMQNSLASRLALHLSLHVSRAAKATRAASRSQ